MLVFIIISRMLYRMIYTVFKRKGLIPKIEVINQYFFVVLILKLYNKVASDIILKCCNHKS